MGKAKRGTQKRKRFSWVNLFLAGLVVSGLVAALFLSGDGGSSGVSSQTTFSGDRFETVAAGELPSFARRPTSKIRETYRYAAAHPDVLQYIPCTCGCRNSGHRHNGECYVKDRHEDGRITFTSHAATWNICLDITRDVMRLGAEGKSLAEIRSYIDGKYGKYGPSTPTPFPPA